MAQEWDWPPGSGARTRVMEGRIHRDTIVLPRGPAYQRSGDLAMRFAVGALKIVAAIVCTALVLGSVGFLVLLVRTA